MTFEAAKKLKRGGTCGEWRPEGDAGKMEGRKEGSEEERKEERKEVKSCKETNDFLLQITPPVTRQFIPGLKGTKNPEPARSFGLVSEGNEGSHE